MNVLKLITKFQTKKSLRGSNKKNIGSKHNPIIQNIHAPIKLALVKSCNNPIKKRDPNAKQTTIKIPKIEFFNKIVLS
ncbi:MAG TPA: hypothetical protein VMZ91_06400 [Candidatus Paceibacterota bacterium]|nr:hypothetical protein [Candidatus Paceibacterota bacterium]